jgi:hypothetical protein
MKRRRKEAIKTVPRRWRARESSYGGPERSPIDCLCRAILPLLLLIGLAPTSSQAAAPTPRQQVLEAMQKRPGDFWPRGSGHAILALPGSREIDKGYLEPGGSFSPGVGSFGVSFWLVNAAGEVLSTSDSLPLDQIRQQLHWKNDRTPPAMQITTSNYQATWSIAGVGRWQLELEAKPHGETRLALVIRSVGPAGGLINTLQWNGQCLLIDHRWGVTFHHAPPNPHLGNEGTAGWKTDAARAIQWTGVDGWGYARFDLPGSQAWTVTIQDPSAVPSPLAYQRVKSAVEVNLPDPQFADCLNAQVAHLMMGLVGNETRPGDPMNYPLNWLRDGAYVIVALARAGELDVAQQLARPFAERDFFGGFGPEADGPGLALWALAEVAGRVKTRAYDEWLWPHVLRKTAWIFGMCVATEPKTAPVVGPIVPQDARRPDLALVCDPAHNGLIVGKMDWHRPILYVNAVTYRGLLGAAEIADRRGDAASAAVWRTQAALIQEAWNLALNSSEAGNDRTYICGLWPSWVVKDVPAYAAHLQRRWNQIHDADNQLLQLPSWTYFNLGEAHQWLELGQPAHAWNTLQWFWEHQAAPGLHTWWEGHGEENTFHRWEQVRGWVAPPNVTPHYWTAAEMLLLQLDMLAGVNETGGTPALIIGAGIPAEWLGKPMSVRNLSTRAGLVDWTWQNKTMLVTLRGSRIPVRLGPSFPADSALRVR